MPTFEVTSQFCHNLSRSPPEYYVTSLLFVLTDNYINNRGGESVVKLSGGKENRTPAYAV